MCLVGICISRSALYQSWLHAVHGILPMQSCMAICIHPACTPGCPRTCIPAHSPARLLPSPCVHPSMPPCIKWAHMHDPHRSTCMHPSRPPATCQDLAEVLLWRLMTPLLMVPCVLIIAYSYASSQPCICSANKHVLMFLQTVMLCCYMHASFAKLLCACGILMPCTSCRD